MMGLCPNIETLLQAVAQKEGLCDFKITITSSAAKGDGYMGVIVSIQVTGGDEIGKKKTLHLVVKSAPKGDAFRNEGLLVKAYEREVYMYKRVFPAFRNFLAEKGLKPMDFIPKCYKTSMVNKNETLVLEDLKHKGFSVWDRRIPMEHEHVKMVMAKLGQYHALSFALRDQDPGRYEKLASSISELLFGMKKFRAMFHIRDVKAQRSLDAVADKEALGVYVKFLDQIEGFLVDLPKTGGDYSIILHGDCWTNNIMFKYKDPNNPLKPSEMVLIDFQLTRKGSPVLDLAYFFYACSSKKVLSNFEYYLDVYYDSLSTHVQELGSDPDKVYPYRVFRQNWKEYARFGLITSMLSMFAMLSEQDEAIDFTECLESGKSIAEAFDYEISSIDEYHDRARRVILHFVDNGLI